jgi:AcrR family transcriptional regulator
VGKGDTTRQAILDRASSLATRHGLAGLTIGRLAEDLGLSKSGLFAHFRSKETLQAQVVEYSAERFVACVIKPALAAPRGEPRLRELFESWLAWLRGDAVNDGCFFVAAAAELDDCPCPARDVLVRHQKDWLETLANVVRTGMAERHFSPTIDAAQFAFELHGLMLGYHSCSRLLADATAEPRIRTAFEALLNRIRDVS